MWLYGCSQTLKPINHLLHFSCPESLKAFLFSFSLISPSILFFLSHFVFHISVNFLKELCLKEGCYIDNKWELLSADTKCTSALVSSHHIDTVRYNAVTIVEFRKPQP